MNKPASKSIRQWQIEIHKNAVNHGFYEGAEANELHITQWICLMHSELSEALEAIRNSIPEGQKGCLSEELADCVIRILDVSEYLHIDIEQAIRKKHDINIKRPYKHGKIF